jgi:PhnB protein
MEIQPYLYFDGRCKEAITFYQEALGAKELVKAHFKDAPANNGHTSPTAHPDKIMHAVLKIGDTHLLMSDDKAENGASHSGFSLSIRAKDPALGEKYFQALSHEGKVTLPFQKTFWSKGYGKLVDKFGVSWVINVSGKQ